MKLPTTAAWNVFFYSTHFRLVLQFLRKMRCLPNIFQPRTLPEKYLWRKIVDRDPQFGVWCGKLETKAYLARAMPSLPTAKVLWRGRSVHDLPAAGFDVASVLKANHASDANLELPPGLIDRDAVASLTSRWMRRRLDRNKGEWGYSRVERVFFVEENLTLPGHEVIDFAAYVFGGRVVHMSLMIGHKSDHIRLARFDADGRNFTQTPLRNPKLVALPASYRPPIAVNEVYTAALNVAGGSDHLRVDLLWNGADLYLTEVTVYPHAGFVDYNDAGLMQRLRDAWDLRASWLFESPQSGWRAAYRAAAERCWPVPPNTDV